MGVTNLDCVISGLFVSESFAVIDVERGTVLEVGVSTRLPEGSKRDSLGGRFTDYVI
jgi:hypothetical protein